MHYKKVLPVLFLMLCLLLTNCSQPSEKQIEVITPQQVYDAVNNDNSLQLIDVRTVKEFQVGHLKTAQNICVTDKDFEARAQQLDKNRPVYVYCKKGGRSADAAKKLAAMGFIKVYDMQGGILNWADDGYDIKE